jgi:hypothetical protein
MQTHAFAPQDWTRPLSGYRLAGWLEVLGMLVGAGAFSWLVRLPGWYWAISPLAGSLVLSAGFYYLMRSRQKGRGKAHLLPQVLVDEKLNKRSIRIAAPISRKESRDSAVENPQTAGSDPDLRQATVLVILGVFCLLPVTAWLLLRLLQVLKPEPAAAYLATPALMLWAAFESLAFFAYWRQPSSGRPALLGMLRSGAQVLAALLLWVYLGLADNAAWAHWLFWIAAGVAVMSALAGSFMPAAAKPLPATAGSAPPVGTHHEQ